MNARGQALSAGPAQAKRVFKAVLEADPANASAEIGMALTAMGRRDFMSADLALRRGAVQDPGRVAIYKTMAEVFDATGSKDFAACAK